jgi:hypothetical protein
MHDGPRDQPLNVEPVVSQAKSIRLTLLEVTDRPTQAGGKG